MRIEFSGSPPKTPQQLNFTIIHHAGEGISDRECTQQLRHLLTIRPSPAPAYCINNGTPTPTGVQHAGGVVSTSCYHPPEPPSRVAPSSAPPAPYSLRYRLSMWRREQLHKMYLAWDWTQTMYRAKSKYHQGYIKVHRGTTTYWQKRNGGE